MHRQESNGTELRYRCDLITPHPELPFAPAGSTVAEIVAAATHDPELHARVVVNIDGHEVRPEWWSRLRPSRHSRIEITLAPAGA